MAIIKKIDTASAGEGVEHHQPLLVEISKVQPLWKTAGQCSLKLIPLMNTSPRETKHRSPEIHDEECSQQLYSQELKNVQHTPCL